MMHEYGELPTMSDETIGSSVYCEDALPAAGVGRRAEDLVDLVDGDLRVRWTTRSVIEPVGTGARIAMPSSLPFSSGMHERRSRARRRSRSGSMLIAAARSTPQVACPCGMVEDLLVVRVRVDRRHEAVLDPEVVVEHLRHRRDAVRRARRVGDDVVLLLVVRVVVDAEDDRHVGVGRRRARSRPSSRRPRGAAARPRASVKKPVDSTRRRRRGPPTAAAPGRARRAP